MDAVAFTPSSLFKLSQFSIESKWFASFDLPSEASGLRRAVVQGVVYIINENTNSDDEPLIVVQLREPNSVFSNGEPNVAILERIITVARSVYTDSVAIPTGWRPHREGRMFSIQSPNKAKNWKARLHFELYPDNTRDLIVFCRTDSIVDFPKIELPLDLHKAAREKFVEAILTPTVGHLKRTTAGITLSQRLPQGFVQGATLQQWYDLKLTTDQRTFVDRPHDGPLRLRGAAGTGKTLSLVVKFLMDGVQAEAVHRDVKFGLVTHSLASVDLVNSIAESIDPSGLMFGLGKHCKLEDRTLYDLANEHLSFNLGNLQPLSLDGREGRRLQFDLVKEVLVETGSSKIIPMQFDGLSPMIRERWLGVKAGDYRFVFDVMNEIASVLDAEGIRAGEEKAERYAKSAGGRPAWLMALPQEIDRQFLLDVHRRYRKILQEMDTLSVDEMIFDFNTFLDSNRWDRFRSRAGYDALFVDELHLFTFVERLVLHKLIKQLDDGTGRPKRPPIFMAYDLKQSPRDTFTQYNTTDSNLFSPSTGLQNSDLIQLQQVFRYTRQIADFLSDLDASFPAINIPGEWNAYVGRAELADGKRPELIVYADEKTLFQSVFRAAGRRASSVGGGGRRVAVLCASAERFDAYLTAAEGQFEGKFLAISSRGHLQSFATQASGLFLACPNTLLAYSSRQCF